MWLEEKLVTPEMAEEILAKMVFKQHVLQKRVRMLEQNLKDGTFFLSPDPISINTDGFLVDGQHRLTAIKNTGISAKMLIAHDVPSNMHEHISDNKPSKRKDENHEV